MAQIIASVVRGEITNESGKNLLSKLFNGDTRDVATIIKEENMLVRDVADEEYTGVAQELVEANSGMVKAIKEKGQQGKVMWFVGQVMKEMAKRKGRGGASAEKSKSAVLEALDLPIIASSSTDKKE